MELCTGQGDHTGIDNKTSFDVRLGWFGHLLLAET